MVLWLAGIRCSLAVVSRIYFLPVDVMIAPCHFVLSRVCWLGCRLSYLNKHLSRCTVVFCFLCCCGSCLSLLHITRRTWDLTVHHFLIYTKDEMAPSAVKQAHTRLNIFEGPMCSCLRPVPTFCDYRHARFRDQSRTLFNERYNSLASSISWNAKSYESSALFSVLRPVNNN